MINKRLIGVVTVKDGWAVQSFGYNKYLPLGKPEVLIDNLDRWGADEILVQSIDRSHRMLGPDIDLLKKISQLSVSTPIVYGGGVRYVDDSIKVINIGADRILLDNLLFENPKTVSLIADKLGSQAVIASLPLSINNNVINHYNYLTKSLKELGPDLINLIDSQSVSEVLISDWKNEGSLDKFDLNMLKKINFKFPKIIAFGGLGSPTIGKKVIKLDNVVGLAIGNPFSYEEHALQDYRKQLKSKYLRDSYFRDELTYDWNK